MRFNIIINKINSKEFIVDINNIRFIVKVSDKKNKKYDVYLSNSNKYLFSYGNTNYQHFYDKLGYYKNLNHNDTERQRLFFLRHKHTNNIYSAKFFAAYFLW